MTIATGSAASSTGLSGRIRLAIDTFFSTSVRDYSVGSIGAKGLDAIAQGIVDALNNDKIALATQSDSNFSNLPLLSVVPNGNPQTIAVSPNIVIVAFSVVETDSVSGFNVGTFRYTAPSTGWYEVLAEVTSTGTANSWVIYVYKNGTAIRSSRPGVTTNGAKISTFVSLAAGEIIDIRVKHSDTVSTQSLNGSPVENWFNVRKVS